MGQTDEQGDRRIAISSMPPHGGGIINGKIMETKRKL